MITNAMQALHDPRVLKSAAQMLAARGVHGDTMLVHVSPREAAMLKAAGGKGDVNPRTGLHEFYDTGGGSDSDMGKDMGSSGGAQGSANGGQGGYGGSSQGIDLGQGQYGPAAVGPGMANNGMSAHNELDDKAVSALDIQGGHLSGVNQASAAMQNNAPSLSDRVGDFFGQNDPGGLLGSDAALSGAGLVGGLLGGPIGSALASGGVSLAQGRGVGASIGAAAGGGLGIGAGKGASIGNAMGQNGAQGPNGTTGPDTGNGAGTDPTMSLISALGPQGQALAGDPTRLMALLRGQG